MHAVWSQAALRWYSLCPHTEFSARNTSLLHHSLLTTHYRADTMLTSSLDVLHILLCRLVCRNSVKLNLVKTGLKSKFGVRPVIFSSWAMSVHNEIPVDTAMSWLVAKLCKCDVMRLSSCTGSEFLSDAPFLNLVSERCTLLSNCACVSGWS